MRKATQYFITAIASLAIFIVGIATGVMLMQTNPRSPNLTYLESLHSKASVLNPHTTQQDKGCPNTQQETK